MAVTVETDVPYLDGYTWVRTTTPDASRTGALPLVVLHGGPGFCHNYLLPLEKLADQTGRTVVLYDQFGCGNSTHNPDAPKDFWTPQLFIDEFFNLVDYLKLGDIHVLGQSWGGMLASEIALTNPEFVKSFSICNSPASMHLWSQAADSLRAALPPTTLATLKKYEATGEYDHPEYVQASEEYDARHVVRLPGGHPDYEASKQQVDLDPTVYHTMNGPNEFHVIGTLKDWSVVGKLNRIHAPVLVLAGEFDEAQPIVWQPFVNEIPNATSVVIEGASHCSHLEKPEEFNRIIGEFLASNDEQRLGGE